MSQVKRLPLLLLLLLLLLLTDLYISGLKHRAEAREDLFSGVWIAPPEIPEPTGDIKKREIGGGGGGGGSIPHFPLAVNSRVVC